MDDVFIETTAKPIVEAENEMKVIIRLELIENENEIISWSLLDKRKEMDPTHRIPKQRTGNGRPEPFVRVRLGRTVAMGGDMD